MKALVNIARIFVGVLFIFSGLVKVNDPTGLSYKMQEFFEVWGWHGLNDYTLALSIVMNAFEIIAGVAILLGWRMRLFSWLLLLLIIFFTFLTGYAEFSGKIKTCGCFGDCIPLKSMQSFIKDLILLVLILFIFFNLKKIKPLFKPGISLVILLLSAIFSFGAQFYVLKYLPYKDCLPYKVGNNILEKRKVPNGAIPDSTVITFVYDKQGQTIEFTADSFPDDFDDSLYHLIKRYDKLVRKGNAEPEVKDFMLISPSDNDTTTALLEQPGELYLYFIRDIDHAANWQEGLTKIYNQAKQKNIPLFYVSALPEATIQSNMTGELKNIPLLKCDAVAVKTAARSSAVLYELNNGTVKGKYSYARLNKVE